MLRSNISWKSYKYIMFFWYQLKNSPVLWSTWGIGADPLCLPNIEQYRLLTNSMRFSTILTGEYLLISHKNPHPRPTARSTRKHMFLEGCKRKCNLHVNYLKKIH